MRLLNGRAFKPSEWTSSGLPIIRIQNLNNPLAEFNYYPLHDIEDRHRIKPGDLLFAWSGTLGSSFGARRWQGPEGVLNQHIFKVIPDEKFISPEYAHVVFKRIEDDIAKKAHGFKTSFVHIKKSDLDNTLLPIPCHQDQQAIASALYDIDTLLGSLDQLITKKYDIQQAATQQLLTGQRRLPGFSGDWEVKRLGDFGQCLRGVTYKGDADLLAYDTDKTYRLLRSNNVQQSAIDTDGLQFVNTRCVSNHQILKPKDILICMANGSKDLVGKAGLFEVSDGHRYTFGAFMGCFRMKTGTDPGFIFALFGTHKYKNYIANLLAGSSINNLRPRDIEKMEFSFPSKNEQAAIATILFDMDTELATLEARRDKARQIKQGMMQELLTGRIRLV